MSGNAVERNISADKRLDTFIQTDFAKGTTVPPGAQTVRGSWEMAVPSGNYQVTVSVGDPGPDLSSSYRINIEGITVIAGVKPTSTNHFASATIVVAVSDGRLTIDTRNGRNTKINYVTVKTFTDTTPPAAPGGVVANPGNALVTLNWNANTEPDLRGYDVYRGTSGPVSTAGTPLNGTTPTDDDDVQRHDVDERDDVLLRRRRQRYDRQPQSAVGDRERDTERRQHASADEQADQFPACGRPGPERLDG